jgi:hypothetical protein
LKKTAFMLTLALAPAAFAACGSDGSDSGPAKAQVATTGDQSDARDDVAAVYDQYFEAVKSGDGENACELLTEDYQQQVVQEAKAFDELDGADCPKATTAFSALFASYEPSLRDIEVQGDTATGTDPGAKGYEAQTLEFELIDGDWKIAGQTDLPAKP